MSVATTLPAEAVQENGIADDALFEVIDGVRVEKPPMGVIQTWVASLLVQKLGHYAQSNGLGRVVSEMLFKLNPPGSRQRRPDLAFLSYERWPRSEKVTSRDGFEAIPELAIEVISRSNSADEVNTKIGEYFRAGVLRVWVIYPASRLVHVYESPKQSTILDITDELTGGDLLPGFRLSLAELFEDAADE